jgi:hypothetical protein
MTATAARLPTTRRDPHRGSRTHTPQDRVVRAGRRRGRWLAYVRLEDPPGRSPITTVGRFDTVEAAQVATDEVWAAR